MAISKCLCLLIDIGHVLAAVYPGCPDEDNYHFTALGDCYYISDIDGSLKIGTWSEAFEFCKAISLNMLIIDSPLEERMLTNLWQTVTGGKYIYIYNFFHKKIAYFWH